MGSVCMGRGQWTWIVDEGIEDRLGEGVGHGEIYGHRIGQCRDW